MELIPDGRVVFGGTFNGNPLSLRAAQVTLEELSRDKGALLRQANQLGQTLMKGLCEAAKECGVPLMTTGFGAAFSLHFCCLRRMHSYRDYLAADRQMLGWFLGGMLDQGILSTARWTSLHERSRYASGRLKKPFGLLARCFETDILNRLQGGAQ